jgi:hypothetical protein
LRSADGELAANDEHRHGLNASVLRHLHFFFDLGDILAAGEIGAHLSGVSSPISAAACTARRIAPTGRFYMTVISELQSVLRTLWNTPDARKTGLPSA